MRTMLDWRSAIRLPTVMVRMARNQSSGSVMSLWLEKPTASMISRATKPAAFDAVARKAVTGVGAPW